MISSVRYRPWARPRLVVCVATAALATPSAAAGGGSLPEMVGTVVPPYPKPFESLSGTCISDGSEVCAHSISTLNGPDGTIVAVLVAALENRVEGAPYWRVLDMHALPPIGDDETWTAEACSLDGVLDPTVGAIVRFRTVEQWIEAEETLWAVKFDPAAGTLSEIAPEDVECILPGS